MRKAAILLALAAGCSTAPCADLLDWIKPAKPALKGGGHGGVCQPAPVMGGPPIGSGPPPALTGPPLESAPPNPILDERPEDRLPPIEPPPPVR